MRQSLAEPNGKELFFTVAEYRERLASVRKQMQRRGIEALLVHTPENILYLSGYQTPGYWMYQCLLVTLSHDPVLLIRNGEIGNALTYSWLSECLTYYDGDDAAEATAKGFVECGVSRTTMGVEMRSFFLTSRVYEDLVRLTPDIRWVDASGTVETCRVKKSPQEVEYIRQAARTAEAGMRAAIGAAQIGKKDNDIAAALHFAMIEAGSEYVATGPFVAAGKRSAIMHGIWGRRPIEPGQTINLEIGGVINRYNAALMRTVSMGPPSVEVKAMALAAEAANRRLIENVKPGAMTADLHAIIDDELVRQGATKAPKGRRWGYSIGLAFPPDWGEGHILSVIDRPNIALETGMVFHLPFGIRAYPRCSVAFSETVLVTETGHEVLTKFDRQLFVK